MMVQAVTSGCMEVGGTGKLVVEAHSCTDVVVVESCSSMVVVNTCGVVLETWCLVEVVEFGNYSEAWTVGKVVAKYSSFVEVMGTGMLGVEAG